MASTTIRPYIRLHQSLRSNIQRRSISKRPSPRSSSMPWSTFFTESMTSRKPSPFVNSIFRRTFASPPMLSRMAATRRIIWTIIGINAAVFGAWTYAINKHDLALRQKLYENYTLMRENWRRGRFWTLLTSAFSHSNLVHFGFNMMAFNALGTILSWSGIGPAHMVALCLGSAVLGSYAFLYNLDHQVKSPVRGGVLGSAGQMRNPDMVSGLGASGMVMGVGAAATCLMPRTPMQLMFIPINIPLWGVMLLYAAADTYFLHSASPIGHAAHLGGGLFGLMYYIAFLRKFGGIAGTVTRVAGMSRR